MTNIILAILLSLIFFTLGFIHIYWSFEGKWGFNSALPTDSNENLVLQPKKRDSITVGVGLIYFGIIYLQQSTLITLPLPKWIFVPSLWIIPSIFILRAIGDFKYVGFFKKIKNTRFAISDTKLFSPLCMGIGVIGIFILKL